MSEHHIDARNLLCPMPLIKLQETMKHCEKGDIIDIICTDPGAQVDIPSWCRIYKHDLIHSDVRETEFHFKLKVCDE